MSFKSLGAQSLSPTTSAIKVIDFAGIEYAISEIIIQPETDPIRWTDDPDLALSSSVGMVLAAGDTLVFQGDWKNFRCVAASGTPTVWVYIYGGGE